MGGMTGRAAGFCSGSTDAGYANPAPGRGSGFGFGKGCGAERRGFGGGGHGWRNMFHATGLPGWMRFGMNAASCQKSDPELEKEALRNRAETLQSEQELIKKRLGEIETGTVTE